MPDTLPSQPILAAAVGVPPMFALLAVLLVAVVLVSLTLLRFRQSLLIGYFLCGIVIANSGLLDWMGEDSLDERIAMMAEFGVVLLMFSLGLEFSLRELRFLRRAAFLGGASQLAATMLPAWLAATAFGISPALALVIAAAIGISSSAVGLKLFQDLRLEGSPGYRLSLGILIFQDLFAIAFVVLLPLLVSAKGAAPWSAMSVLALKSLAFLAVAGALGRWVIPRLLHAVARERNRELFTLTVFGLCVGVAWLGGVLDLSLAMGAFVAGVVVSESIYRHRIRAEVQPFKDVFLTLFFVSVGLGIHLPTVLSCWWQILALTALLMLFKLTLVTFLGVRLGWPAHAAVLGALGVSTSGEFSLVVLQRAAEFRPWPEQTAQILTGSIALSMVLLPLVARVHVPLGAWLERRGIGRRTSPFGADARPREKLAALSDHTIVCGYGPVGRELIMALDRAGAPCLVVELNVETVRFLLRTGRPVLFADATHQETWDLAGLQRARMVAFTFADGPVVAAALPLIRDRRPDIVVTARAKFASDVDRLKELGVDLVVHDELEAGRAMVRHGMSVYEKPGEDESREPA